ncbi:MAG: nitrous oxide-stimulated promoter family protein [Candidatus Bathyarchaeota archaeon]
MPSTPWHVMGTIEKDSRVLAKFIEVYCRTKHRDADKTVHEYDPVIRPALCPDCHELLSYSIRRRELCPQDPKPTCKNCEIHCYRPEMRTRIRGVMRHSGMHMILRGRVDWVLHYLL